MPYSCFFTRVHSVAVSGLEMQQNASFGKWTAEVVDAKLKEIMADCFKQCYETAVEFVPEGQAPSLVDGANCAGFLKVANAMKDQGEFW
jgi:glutamate dehydrogenase (NADP+)